MTPSHLMLQDFRVQQYSKDGTSSKKDLRRSWNLNKISIAPASTYLTIGVLEPHFSFVDKV